MSRSKKRAQRKPSSKPSQTTPQGSQPAPQGSQTSPQGSQTSPQGSQTSPQGSTKGKTQAQLRFWGIAELLYGLFVAWLALTFIPKHPSLPGLIAAYGALSALAGLGLLKAHAWGWRLSLVLGGFALLLGVALITLTVTAGAYWLSVFGVLGWGVAISAGLLISGVAQLLGLYPALKLRALLSAPVLHHMSPASGRGVRERAERPLFSGGEAQRSDLPAQRPTHSPSQSPSQSPRSPLQRLTLASLALILSGGLLGFYAGHTSLMPPLSPQQRDASLAYTRAVLEGYKVQDARGEVNLSPASVSAKDQDEAREALLTPLEGAPTGVAPLTVTFWAGGARLARATGRGHDLASALRDAASSLKDHPQLRGKRLAGGRLVIDRAVGKRALLSAWGPLLSLSVDPGVDGLMSEVGGRTRTLLPSDLIEQQRFGVAPIVPGVPELRFGLDAQWVKERLGAQGLSCLRTEQWVESRELTSPEEREALGARALPSVLTLRGSFAPDLARQAEARVGLTPQAPTPHVPTLSELSALAPHERLAARAPLYLEAAHLAGGYLSSHVNPDGRFDYQYFPYTGERKQPGGASYSLPRHSGAIYGLASLYALEPKPQYKHTSERAIAWLRAQASPECGGWLKDALCLPLGQQGEATLGNSALTALALLTYANATGEERHLNFTEGLLRFLLAMQRDDGDFHHRYLLADGSFDPDQRSMFASEQAAFAFVLAAKRWPSGPWLKAAERALDAVTQLKYQRDFLSEFFYGADHWSCLAAHSAYPLLKHKRYLDFCLGYSRFLQRLQYRHSLGEGDPSFDGHYGFGYLSPPQAPATGGFGEGVMATLALARDHGVKPEAISDIYDQAQAGLEALLRDQITPHNGWMIHSLPESLGAFRRSLAESEVRVDFVQHAASSLLMIQRLTASISVQGGKSEPR